MSIDSSYSMEFTSKRYVSNINTVKQTYIPDLWLTVTVYDQHKAKTVKSHTLPFYYHKHCSPSPW